VTWRKSLRVSTMQHPMRYSQFKEIGGGRGLGG
jgi:hypothetical protein